MLSSKTLVAFMAMMVVLLFAIGVKAQTPASSWTLHSNINGVNVYYKLGKCTIDPALFNNPTANPSALLNPDVVLLLKFENTTSNDKQISWNDELVANSSATVHQLSLAGMNMHEVICEDAPAFKLSSPNGNNLSAKDAMQFLNITVLTN